MAIATATLIGIASVAVGAVGAFQAAQARKRQAQYMAEVAKNNAIIAQQNIADAAARGRQEEYEHRQKVARAIGSQRAATAGAGLVVDEAGTTPDDLVFSMMEAGELDVLKIRDNVVREQRQFEIQKTGFLAQEGQYKLQASSERPLLAGLTAGLGGISANADVLFPNAGVS